MPLTPGQQEYLSAVNRLPDARYSGTSTVKAKRAVSPGGSILP
jgi:hypothetical protein